MLRNITISNTAKALACVSFFGGVGTAIKNNHHILTDTLVDTEFLLQVSKMKDAGTMNFLLGCGIVAGGSFGLTASFFASVMLAASNLSHLSKAKKISIPVAIGGLGLFSAAVIGYGCYNAGYGFAQVGLGMQATRSRV